MPIEYAKNDEMEKAVIDLISDTAYEEFNAIRDYELGFQIAAKVKTNADGEQEPTTGEPVVVRRIGPADAVFLNGHFKIYICDLRWRESSRDHQKAMLHQALMRILIENTDSGIKIKMRKPDVVTFQQTIVRFGAWEDQLIQLRNNLVSAQKKAKATLVNSA